MGMKRVFNEKSENTHIDTANFVVFREPLPNILFIEAYSKDPAVDALIERHPLLNLLYSTPPPETGQPLVKLAKDEVNRLLGDCERFRRILVALVSAQLPRLKLPAIFLVITRPIILEGNEFWMLVQINKTGLSGIRGDLQILETTSNPTENVVTRITNLDKGLIFLRIGNGYPVRWLRTLQTMGPTEIRHPSRLRKSENLHFFVMIGAESAFGCFPNNPIVHKLPQTWQESWLPINKKRIDYVVAIWELQNIFGFRHLGLDDVLL